MKTSNLSADNFQKVLGLDGLTPEPAMRSSDTGQRIPCFDSCQSDQNIDVQLASSWVPKVVRKCESKHWFSCGADGRAAGGRVAVYGHVNTKFSGMDSFSKLWGSAHARASRARGAPLSTALYIYDCLYPSVSREILPRVPILWIVLGVSVALSALVVGIIVYRKRTKRNERYFIKCYRLYECFVL